MMWVLSPGYKNAKKTKIVTRVDGKVGVAGAGPVVEELKGQGEVVQAQAQGLGGG